MRFYFCCRIQIFISRFVPNRFTASRRRYTVTFSTMVQVNEETGNRRAVMLSLPTKEEQAERQRKEEGEQGAKAKSEGEETGSSEESKGKTGCLVFEFYIASLPMKGEQAERQRKEEEEQGAKTKSEGGGTG